MDLRGGVKFPTGGIARERKLNRLDSGADSIVWMEEAQAFAPYALSSCSGHFFARWALWKNCGTPYWKI